MQLHKINSSINTGPQGQTVEELRAALDHCEKLLNTLSNTAILFLSCNEESFDNMMSVGLNHFADVLDIDRISVWRNFDRPDGKHAEQIFRWYRKAGGATIPNKEAEDLAYATYAPRWEKLLGDGESINSPVKLLPEAAVLKVYDILSLFVTPVFIDKKFWGFVFFEDHREERFFNEDSTDIMRSAAFLCANTVVVHEKTLKERNSMAALKSREQMLKSLNRMADLLISHEEDDDFDDIMSIGLSPVCRAADVDRVAVFRRLDDKGTLGQVYLWKGVTLPLDEELRLLPEIPAIARWMGILLNDECINANVRDLPEDEAEFLGRYQIKSVYMVPIFTHGQLWGMVAFEDHMTHRIYSDDCLDLLQSAAHLCAGAVVRAEMEREIQWLVKETNKVYLDPQTGIYNKRYFDKNLEDALINLARPMGWLSMMMIDVDYFMPYNDAYGRSEGDLCLKKVAGTLASCLTRKGDFLARYGGDEFVAVLPNTDENGARVLAEKLLGRIRESRIPHSANAVSEYVTVTIGVVTGKVYYMQNGEDYIKRAEEMQLSAKQGGRNNYVYGVV